MRAREYVGVRACVRVCVGTCVCVCSCVHVCVRVGGGEESLLECFDVMVVYAH